MNLSGSILIWTLDIMPAEFYQKLEDTFIGNVEWEGEDTWGNYLYVVSKEDYSNMLLRTIRKHNMYVRDYYDDHGRFIVVFKFTPEQQEAIVKPFIEGRYSEIDRNYVNKNFKRSSGTGKISTNWQILHKDKALRDHWERELNVTSYIQIHIPEDAEVWSKIKKENEILGYETFLQAKEEVLESM